MARGMRVCALVLSLMVGMISLNIHYGVEAQVHHVVGGDNGWNPSTDIKSWSSNRDFKVGDSIWFTYSVDEDSISELKSREEYESCDVSNPIRMFTDGVDKVSLDGEGTRYFVSAKSDNCKNGLKLDVEVLPQTTTTVVAVDTRHETQSWAPPPASPSARSPPPASPFARPPPPPPPATPSTPPPPPPATPSASPPLGLQTTSSTMMVMMISFGLVGLLLLS